MYPPVPIVPTPLASPSLPTPMPILLLCMPVLSVDLRRYHHRQHAFSNADSQGLLSLPHELKILKKQSCSLALVLLVGLLGEHPTCKNWEMRRWIVWCGYLFWLRCRFFKNMVWPSPLPSPNHIISCFINIQNGLLLWYRLIQVVPEKRHLNGFLWRNFEKHQNGKNYNDTKL